MIGFLCLKTNLGNVVYQQRDTIEQEQDFFICGSKNNTWPIDNSAVFSFTQYSDLSNSYVNHYNSRVTTTLALPNTQGDPVVGELLAKLQHSNSLEGA